jgi:hypothetical protein
MRTKECSTEARWRRCRIPSRLIIVAVCVLLIPKLGFGSVPAHTTALQAGIWTAGARVVTATVKAGTVAKAFRVSLSPASLAYVLATFVGGILIESAVPTAYQGVQAWMVSAGFRIAAGTLEKSYSSYGLEAGGTLASTYAAGSFTSSTRSLYPRSTNLVSLLSAWQASACGNDGKNMTGGCTAGVISAAIGVSPNRLIVYGQRCNGQPDSTGRYWYQNESAGTDGQVQTVANWTGATPTEVKDKAATDLTAGSAVAQSAVVEVEDYANSVWGSLPWQGVAGTWVPSIPGVLDKPATGVTPSTTQTAYDVPVASGIGAEWTDIETEADPAAGTEVTPVPAAATKYVDPSLTGTVPALADWPVVGNFGTQWASFRSSVQSTGLFTVSSGFFGGVPSSGSSTIQITGGVFGNHTYDLSTRIPSIFWSILQSVILVLSSYAALRIVIVNK